MAMRWPGFSLLIPYHISVVISKPDILAKEIHRYFIAEYEYYLLRLCKLAGIEGLLLIYMYVRSNIKYWQGH